MTAALAGQDGDPYANRILAAVTASDLHAVAEAVARDRSVPESSRRTLQLLFANRMRQLWPASFRRSSW